MNTGKDCIGVGCGAIIINDNNEVLLIKRSSCARTEAGYWTRPGGEVEYGESIEEAVKREVKEEVGLEIKVERFLEMTQIIDPTSKTHWIALGYLAKYISGSPKNLERNKHTDIRWFPLYNLPQMITSYTKNSIVSYLNSKNNPVHSL